MAQSFETEKTFAVFLTVKRHTRRLAEVRKAGRPCVFQNIRGRVMPQNSTAMSMTLHQEGGLSGKQPDVQRKAPGRDRSSAQKGGGRQQLTNTAGRGQAAWPQARTLWSSLSDV